MNMNKQTVTLTVEYDKDRHDPPVAWDWSELLDAQVSDVTISEPDNEDTYILVSGNPFDGFTFSGPFASAGDAEAWAYENVSDVWWFAKVDPTHPKGDPWVAPVRDAQGNLNEITDLFGGDS